MIPFACCGDAGTLTKGDADLGANTCQPSRPTKAARQNRKNGRSGKRVERFENLDWTRKAVLLLCRMLCSSSCKYNIKTHLKHCGQVVVSPDNGEFAIQDKAGLDSSEAWVYRGCLHLQHS